MLRGCPRDARCLALLAAFVAWTSEARLGLRSQPFLVKLRKEHAKNVSDADKQKHHGGGYFIGDIDIGKTSPQRLKVIFLTTAGLVVLPGTNCVTEGCRGHHHYSPALSTSSLDINRDGALVDPAGGPRAPAGARRDTTKVDYQASHGKATNVEGNLVRDDICMGDKLGNNGIPEPMCSKVDIVVATREEEEVFGNRPEDGMIGLARKELSLENNFNILECISDSGLAPQFGFFVEDDARRAEITFGGYDKNRLDSPLKWTPVVLPEEGHWIVDIVAVRVGKKKLLACGKGRVGCRGLMSTGSPFIHIPESDSDEVMGAINGGKSTDAGCDLPELSFELAGGVTLTLAVEDYAGPRCEPEVGPHHIEMQLGGANIWMLGEPFFRRYYTVFQWGPEPKLGYGRSAVERNCLRLEKAGFPTDRFKCTWPSERSEEL